MNSSFLSAFRLLALNEGPAADRRTGCETGRTEPARSARRTLTSVVVQVRQRLLVRKEDVLVLGDDLPPQVLPAGR